jgi:Flp pilus assembly protein TadG
MSCLANRGVRRFRAAARSSVGRFLRERAGNIGVVFALLSVPMVGAVGLAVDYQQLASARQFLKSQVDAAALGGAGAGPDGDAARWLERAERATRAHFAQSGWPATMEVSGGWISDDRSVAEARATVDLAFVRILPGIPDAVEVSVRAVAELALPRLVYEEPELAQLDPEAGDYNRLSAYCFDPAAAGAIGEDGRSQFTVIADNAGPSYDFSMPRCEAGEVLSYRLLNVRDARTRPHFWDDPLRERYVYHSDTTISGGLEHYDLDGWSILETVLCPTLDDCRPISEGGIIPEGKNRVPVRADEACTPGKFMCYGWEDRPPGRGWTDRDCDDIRLIVGCPVFEYEGEKRLRLVG